MSVSTRRTKEITNGSLTYMVRLVDRVSTVEYSVLSRDGFDHEIGEEGRLASILRCLPHGLSASVTLTPSSFLNVEASAYVAFVAIVGSGGELSLISSVSRPPTHDFALCPHPCTNHNLHGLRRTAELCELILFEA